MPKIYTKTGDKGETSMLDGKRVCKCCLEMEAVGEVDELNAFLGMLIEEMEDDFKPERKKLISIQNNLFVIGSNLAALQSPGIKTYKLTNLSRHSGIPLAAGQTYKLEKWIDEMEGELPKLKNFILPGGCEEAALSFYARAVCRRAERCVIKLNEKHQVPTEIKQYLNRLSDCLFVLGRWLNFKSGIEEVKWKK